MTVLYINSPPGNIPCWYCDKTIPYRYTSDGMAEYICKNHEAEALFRCVKHKLPAPNWFFNVVHITLGDLRLYHNLHSGNTAEIRQFVPASPAAYGSYWETVKRFPAEFLITNPIKKLTWYLKHYHLLK